MTIQCCLSIAVRTRRTNAPASTPSTGNHPAAAPGNHLRAGPVIALDGAPPLNEKPAAKPHVAASRQEVRTMANHHAAVLPLALDFGPDPGPAGAMYTELLLPEVSQGPGRDLRRPPPRRRRGRRLPRRGKEALAGLARADTRPQRQAQPLNAEPPWRPPKRPTGEGASTWRSALCSGTGRSAAPKRLISGGRTSPSRPPAPGGALLEVRRSKTCWPSGRPTLTRRPWSPGSPTDRSAGQLGRKVRAAALHAGTELQNAGRWQSTSMPVRYSRGQKARGPAAARWPGTTGSTGETLPLCGVG